MHGHSRVILAPDWKLPTSPAHQHGHCGALHDMGGVTCTYSQGQGEIAKTMMNKEGRTQKGAHYMIPFIEQTKMHLMHLWRQESREFLYPFGVRKRVGPGHMHIQLEETNGTAHISCVCVGRMYLGSQEGAEPAPTPAQNHLSSPAGKHP